MYFLGDLVANGQITAEEATIISSDPVALMSLFDEVGNLTLSGPTIGEPDFAYADDDLNFTQPYVLIDPNDPQSGYRPYHPPGSWVNADGALIIAEVVTGADGVERTIITELMADAYNYGDLDAGPTIVTQQPVPDLEIHYYNNDPTNIRPYMWDFELKDWVPILYPGEEVIGGKVYSRDDLGNSVEVRDYEYTVGFGDSTPDEQALFAAYTPEELTALEQRRSSNFDLLNGRESVVSDVDTLEASVTDAAEVARLAHLAADAPGATDADRAAAADADTVLADLQARLAAARLADDDDGDDGDLLINDSGSPIRTRNATDDGYEPLTGQQVDDLREEGIRFFGNDPDHERPYRWNEFAGESGDWEVVLWANQRLLTTGDNAGHIIDIDDGPVRNQLAYDHGRQDTFDPITEEWTRVSPIDFDYLPLLNGVYDLAADADRAEEAILHLFIPDSSGASVVDTAEQLRTGFNSNPNFDEEDWVSINPDEVAGYPQDRVRYVQYRIGSDAYSDPIYGWRYQVVAADRPPNYYEENNLLGIYNELFVNDFIRAKRQEFLPAGAWEPPNARDYATFVPSDNAGWNFDFSVSNEVQTFFFENLIDYMAVTGISIDSIVNSEVIDIFSGGPDGDNPEIFDIHDFLTGSWDDEEEDIMTQKLRDLAETMGVAFGSDANMTSERELRRFAIFAAALFEPINERIQDEIHRRQNIAGGYTGTLSIPAWYEHFYGVQAVPLLDDDSTYTEIVTDYVEPPFIFTPLAYDPFPGLGGWTSPFPDPGPGGVAGGGYIGGWDGGMDDTIPATADGSGMFALSSGEFVIPADVVSHLGDGNNQNGASKLYQLLDEVRSVKTGMVEQPAPINDGIVSNLLGDHNG
jgi:hypothetical protein